MVATKFVLQMSLTFSVVRLHNSTRDFCTNLAVQTEFWRDDAWI
ncbi:hypothetical protein AmDm5_2788 [Acetobacter malorum]|nr:hypothetical protein AmDm5_2788 [Acetobacter malorum]